MNDNDYIYFSPPGIPPGVLRSDCQGSANQELWWNCIQSWEHVVHGSEYKHFRVLRSIAEKRAAEQGGNGPIPKPGDNPKLKLWCPKCNMSTGVILSAVPKPQGGNILVHQCGTELVPVDASADPSDFVKRVDFPFEVKTVAGANREAAEARSKLIPDIVDEPYRRGCENDKQAIGYLAAEISKLRSELRSANGELERERIRLAACEVVALADTPESATKARDMLTEYRSAACDSVARRVDECMRLRVELAELRSRLDKSSSEHQNLYSQGLALAKQLDSQDETIRILQCRLVERTAAYEKKDAEQVRKIATLQVLLNQACPPSFGVIHQSTETKTASKSLYVEP